MTHTYHATVADTSATDGDGVPLTRVIEFEVGDGETVEDCAVDATLAEEPNPAAPHLLVVNIERGGAE